jgi:hypothetical protein
MVDVTVKVDPDHLQKLARPTQQVAAVAELIWNALDADANNIVVEFQRNELAGIESIIVTDDGTGIEYSLCSGAFGNLGGSWKPRAGFTERDRRPLHGRNGEGRFRAFALGSRIEWITVGDDTVRGRMQTRVHSSLPRPDKFTIDEPVSTTDATGTRVRVADLQTTVQSISSDTAVSRLTRDFAIYLSRHKNVRINYDGRRLDPASVIAQEDDIELPSPGRGAVHLKIIEWTEEFPRELVLCDGDSFPLDIIKPSIHAPQFWFSAYLSWGGWDAASVKLAELDEEPATILANARDAMRTHFRERAKERTLQVVDGWKQEEVYPFKGEPATRVEEVKRDLFDVVAVQAIPGLSAEPRAKKLSLRLIREAIEHSPNSLKVVLQEVLDLPASQLDDLAALLDRTSLASMIASSQIVSERLDFLRSLELLLFDSDIRRDVLERTQLHRILAAESWIFGDEYMLAVDDQGIKEVLKRHVDCLGREDVNLASEIKLEDRKRGIVDMMLTKTIQDSSRQQHLVVELKRPTVIAGYDERQQIESYAMAVANDARFRDSGTKWDFLLIANDLSRDVRKLSTKRGQPAGLIHDDDEIDMRIWVRQWGSIIEERRRSLHFFQDQLNLDPTRSEALEFLQRKHAQFLPSSVADAASEAS